MRRPESGHRYQEVQPGAVRCLDLGEESPLPSGLATGTKGCHEFQALTSGSMIMM